MWIVSWCSFDWCGWLASVIFFFFFAPLITPLIGCGLYLLGSFINHSCTPNATYVIDADREGHTMTLRALTQIEAVWFAAPLNTRKLWIISSEAREKSYSYRT
jgi:hypothetical protein